jgi:hypothetical protein
MHFERILEKLNCQKRYPELADGDFREIEQAAGFILPDDYKTFLRMDVRRMPKFPQRAIACAVAF